MTAPGAAPPPSAPVGPPAGPPTGPVRSDGLLVDLAEASRILGRDLFSRLVELARSPRLLVATDYDGTIAPLVDRPTRAFPLDLNVATMRALSTLPSTQSAVISGRSLRDLAAMSRLPREVHLVGSHGGEFGIDDFDDIAPETERRLTALRSALLDLHRDNPDVFLEFKPLGAAVHLRGHTAAQRAAVTVWVQETCERIGIEPVRGRDVFDLTVIPGSKGDALDDLRTRLGADAVLYIGDDVADEAALATLRDDDLGLRVGTDGETRALSRISDPHTVGIALAALYELRRSWLFGRASTPIERHSLLGNGHSTALVDPNGRICWMPHPLPHSASVFSEILGSSTAGYFSVSPADPGIGSESRAEAARARPLAQRYRDETMTVVTRWADLEVADYLAPVPDDSQDTVLVRVLTGTAPAQIRFAPRLDYGAAPTSLEAEPGLVRVDNTSEPMALHAPGVDFDIVEENGSHTAVADV
ncbi:MAG TPA: trehalose-phosphatase, partial [Brevibacterium sp.]|nr:trehalose-phosphatase [Brevibacterium sp.]